MFIILWYKYNFGIFTSNTGLCFYFFTLQISTLKRVLRLCNYQSPHACRTMLPSAAVNSQISITENYQGVSGASAPTAAGDQRSQDGTCVSRALKQATVQCGQPTEEEASMSFVIFLSSSSSTLPRLQRGGKFLVSFHKLSMENKAGGFWKYSNLETFHRNYWN